jgi:hypothetical protein
MEEFLPPVTKGAKIYVLADWLDLDGALGDPRHRQHFVEKIVKLIIVKED